MSNYCRAITPGGTFFFTMAAFDRKSMLTTVQFGGGQDLFVF